MLTYFLDDKIIEQDVVSKAAYFSQNDLFILSIEFNRFKLGEVIVMLAKSNWRLIEIKRDSIVFLLER